MKQADIDDFVKPNFYLLQNVLTFMLPGRKSQFEFYHYRMRKLHEKLAYGSANVKIQRRVEWESLYIEFVFLTYLLSEEMGTYFMAMANFPEGDIISSVLSRESYCYAHNFYQLPKRRSRDFFSRLMIYPITPELRAISSMPDDQESVELLNRVVTTSCTYLWEKKENIRSFREQYKLVFNSYKHGMSILYNMRADVKVKTKKGQELSGFSESPIVLSVKTDVGRSTIKECWRQLKGFATIESDVKEVFNLLYDLFYVVVERRIDFVRNLLQSHRYEPSTGTYVPFKNVRLSMRLFNVSKLSEDDQRLLQEKLGLTLQNS